MFLPHRVVPNTWRFLAVIPTLNAQLHIEMGINELFSICYCKTHASGYFMLACHPREGCFVDEASGQSQKEWTDELFKILGWQIPEGGAIAFLPFLKCYRPICFRND